MTKARQPDFLNYNNGSQYPFTGGGLYVGKIVSVSNKNRVSVRIPALSLTIKDCTYLNVTATQFPASGDSVVCGFMNNDNQELVIIGKLNMSADVFATKAEFDALEARVDALEAASHTHA